MVGDEMRVDGWKLQICEEKKRRKVLLLLLLVEWRTTVASAERTDLLLLLHTHSDGFEMPNQQRR